MNVDQLVTVEELAKILKVPVSWVYERTRQGGHDTIPLIRFGKYLRFEPEKVIEWFRERSRTKD